MPIPPKSFPALGSLFVRGLLGRKVSWYTPEKYPRSLSDALRVYIEGKGLSFGAVYCERWNHWQMCFGRDFEYWLIDVVVSSDRSKYADVEELKDIVYDEMKKKVDRKVGRLRKSLPNWLRSAPAIGRLGWR